MSSQALPNLPPAALARDGRSEARSVVGAGHDARVLEPSPPAVDDGEWYADDPVSAPGEPGRRLVSPVPNADLTWEEWLRGTPERAEWAAARWLGAYRRLPAPPATLADTRLALHRLAAYVISPARRRANGKIALRWTLAGVGTPFFGDDEQVRVMGDVLVRQRGGDARAARVDTLSRAASFALDGPPDVAWAREFDVPAPGDPDAPLGLDPAAAAFLGDWYGFAWSVLEEVRASHSGGEASRVQLWPEHLDCAFECLTGDRRTTLGASPGDATLPEPYLYVLPHDPERAPSGAAWNATAFHGAILPLSELVSASDQRATALGFLQARLVLVGS